MRALAEPPFGAVTVSAKKLQPFLGPATALEAPVKIARKSFVIPGSIAVNVIDGEEPPIGFSAAYAPPAVSGDHFLSKVLDSLGLIVKANRAESFGHQFPLTAALAKPSRLQSSLTLLHGVSRLLAARFAKLHRSVVWLTTTDATPRPHQLGTTPCRFVPDTFSAMFAKFHRGVARVPTTSATPFLIVTMVSVLIRLLLHAYIIPQHVYASQGF